MNVSFKSHINFVNSDEFASKFSRGEFIYYKDNQRNYINSDEFYTTDVSTCIGGGFVAPKLKASGFHLWDYYKYSFADDDKKSQYERGLLLGSKDLPWRKYSIPNFCTMKEYMSKKFKEISLFQQHKYKLENSSLHYSLDTDTWTINTTIYDDSGRKKTDVVDLEQLLDAFCSVRISRGDSLSIGGKEIHPTDCPNIFEV